jgi:hypothetical protein
VRDEPVHAAQPEPVGGPGEQPVLQAGAVLRRVDAQVADVGEARGAGAGVALRAGQGRSGTPVGFPGWQGARGAA